MSERSQWEGAGARIEPPPAAGTEGQQQLCDACRVVHEQLRLRFPYVYEQLCRAARQEFPSSTGNKK